MTAVFILAANSWKESLRTKFFLLSLLFGGVVLYLSLLLGLLATDEEVRVLQDFGLAFIELMGLAGAVFSASTTILREMETKTIYMILTRPVARWQYLVGRFAGLMLSTAAAMALMASMHVAILLAKGWSWSGLYVAALAGAYLKVLITAALAMFMAIFSTSVLSGLTITGILWSLGHFIPEIRYMVTHKSRHAVFMGTGMSLLTRLLPDLQLFNLRDRLQPLAGAGLDIPVAAWLGYAVVYAGAWLAASVWLFNRKEF